MAGGVTNAERESSDPQLLAVGQVPVGRRQRPGAHPEREGLLRDVIVQHAVRLMEVNRGPRLGLEPRHPEHVVDVRMGEPDPDRTNALGPQLVGDQPRFLAGVDDRTLGRRFIDHEVTVLYELAVGYLYEAHR